MPSKCVYQDSSQSERARVDDLIARMRLPEKIAQLGAVWAASLIDGDVFSPAKASEALAHGAGQITRIGASTVLRPSESATLINAIQRHLRDETRLGIPTVLHEESCSGFLARDATQFPQAIGMASTWAPDMVEAVGEVIREQMCAVGARQTLAPVLDIARDARWGRVEETFGEDPHLVSRMGVAYVRGIQGDDRSQGVIATAKHFMGYGASEGGLNWAPSLLPRRELLERILPPFEAAIREADLGSVMNGYQEIDGIPCGASKWLLDDILRGELGFEGTVVADYFTVICLLTYHKVAADKAEAGARCLEAGLDVELPTVDCYGEPLMDAVRSGRVDEGLIDRALRRVLRQKFQLGLFESPFVEAGRAAEVFDTPAQRALARRVGQSSMVLLKNEGDRLPLDPATPRIALIGPSVDSIRLMQGDYAYPSHIEIVFGPVHEPGDGSAKDARGSSELLPSQKREAETDLLDCFPPSVSLLDGVRAAVSAETEISVAQGCTITGEDRAGFAEAVEMAAQADVVILGVGERSGLVQGCTSGEANDRADVSLPGLQAELVAAVAATGTPCVVVLLNGRPLALTDIEPHAAAILEAWLPGEEGGHAIADVLFGAVSPAGRLPVTLPRSSGQLPLYYNHKPSGARSQFHGDYADLACSPLYPFGHGLSYTRFEYTALSISETRPDADACIEIEARVRNTGARAGEEVVQLYVRDRVASLTRPVKELKGFARIALEAGEERRVGFVLDLGQLAFYDRDMRFVVEPGEVEIMLGASSEDIRLEAVIDITGEIRSLERRDVRPTRVFSGPAD
jgi:beta-glucosidase